MCSSANKRQGDRASKLDTMLFLALIFCVPPHLSAQSIDADKTITLGAIRVQDFNGGMGTRPEQIRRLANQSASITITSINSGRIYADLNTDFGSFNLVFVREIDNAWSADKFSGCVRDIDVIVTFRNGEVVSTKNPSSSSAVQVESFDVEKKYKGNGCLNKAAGSLRFYIDISSAAAAGRYSGNMTIEVKPIY